MNLIYNLLYWATIGLTIFLSCFPLFRSKKPLSRFYVSIIGVILFFSTIISSCVDKKINAKSIEKLENKFAHFVGVTRDQLMVAIQNDSFQQLIALKETQEEMKKILGKEPKGNPFLNQDPVEKIYQEIKMFMLYNGPALGRLLSSDRISTPYGIVMTYFEAIKLIPEPYSFQEWQNTEEFIVRNLKANLKADRNARGVGIEKVQLDKAFEQLEVEREKVRSHRKSAI